MCHHRPRGLGGYRPCARCHLVVRRLADGVAIGHFGYWIGASLWVSCEDGGLSHGEVGEGEDRSLPVPLVSGRGHKTGEVRTRLPPELWALWTMMRVGLWIVVPGPDGEAPPASRRR